MLKTKKLYLFLLLVCILTPLFTGCSEQKPESKLRYRMAYRVMDDGWVYVFANQYIDGDEDFSSQSDTQYPFSFRGVNLRYRYSEDYTTTVEVENDDGTKTEKTILQSSLRLGQSDSQIERSDLNKIAEYLGYERDGSHYTTSELLALTPSDLDFSYIDADMFIELLQECLTAETDALGKYPLIPSHALFTEPVYLDDYKIQIGLIGGFGTIEVVLFDVLYRVGDGLTDYVQLYDLVKNKTASEEQIQLLNTLQEIEQGVAENNDPHYKFDEYKDKKIADVALSRLYTMLDNIVECEYREYIVMPQ